MTDFPIGTRVRLLHDVDRYPHFVAPAGARGTVVDIGDPAIFATRMDDVIRGAEDWGNEIHWDGIDDARRDLAPIPRKRQIPLDHTSPELIAALTDRGITAEVLGTGGGCTVLRMPYRVNAQPEEDRRELWLTREEGWVLGFYDFTDPEDEGITVQLYTGNDDVQRIASEVEGILQRTMGR